jgi:thiamine transport system substrate-binding protein
VLKKLLVTLLLCLSAKALAATKPVLTLYSYSAFTADWGPGPKIKRAFEQHCQCELKFVALEDGVALLNRLRLEGNRSKADIVLGLDNNLISRAAETGLFATSPIKLTNLALPIKWQDSTFIPFDYGYFAFIYNKKRLKNPPHSLKELVTTQQPLRIIYSDPRVSTPGFGLLLWMKKVFGNQSNQAWQQLAKKTVTVTRGWSEAYGLFLKGEADLVLSYSTSPAYHLINEHNDNYQAAMFSDGHYLQIEVAAKLKSSKQPALADQFLQFMTSTEFQQIIPETNWMYPAIRVNLPPGFAQLPLPDKALTDSSEEIARQHRQWLTEWQHAVSQ